MITVGAFDAKTYLSSLLERVERREEVVITCHGRAIARLVLATAAERADVGMTTTRMKEVRAHTTLGGLSWRELRDEGRR